MVGDHDHLLLIGQVNADDRVRERDQSQQPGQPRVAVAITTGHAATVTHERPPPAMGHQARKRIRRTFLRPASTRRTSFYAGIAATALICFIFGWNELLFARVLTATVAETATVFLTSFVTSQGLFLAQLCAAAFVVSLPILVADFSAQDKLVQGLSLGSVK
ncbi:hypothetical protein AB0368_37445 [Actinoplanes sp. NPDC051475]|uniref:hypothetical protein n=1 Tax=Actinoplanes sp. NPDC051475 TaxID=3157225 RepID=UPI0034509953